MMIMRKNQGKELCPPKYDIIRFMNIHANITSTSLVSESLTFQFQYNSCIITEFISNYLVWICRPAKDQLRLSGEMSDNEEGIAQW